MSKTTDFGYQQVPEDEKARKVAGVFDSVASRYDLMNDLMSGGMHRMWKRFAVEASGVRPGESVLDVAAGTGDLALRPRIAGRQADEPARRRPSQRGGAGGGVLG